MKFLKKGIKDNNNKYYPCWYSKSFDEKNNLKGITIYAKNVITGLPLELNPVNNSDSTTDYFEKDKILIKTDNQYYKEIADLYLN